MKHWLWAVMRRRARNYAAWAVEGTGVGVVAVGAGMAWEPAGVMLAGAYLVLVANMAVEGRADRRERTEE